MDTLLQGRVPIFFFSLVSLFFLHPPPPYDAHPCHSFLAVFMQKLSAGLHTVHRRRHPISPPLSPHKHGTPAPARLLLARLARPAQASQALLGSWSTEVDPSRAIALYNATKGLLGALSRTAVSVYVLGYVTDSS